MKLNKLLLSAFFILSSASFSSQAELQDQGLNSILVIIDKAVTGLSQPPVNGDEEAKAAENKNAVTAIINLSRTLGTLSYSRLQCGQADVLSEFTQRVQAVPEANRNEMRDAFQEGFDKSKAETNLLSQDECERLTLSRQRSEVAPEANVATDKNKGKVSKPPAKAEAVVLPPEDPKFRQLRIAELSGQLAFKKKFCQDDKIFNRDYNDFLEAIPEAYRDEAKNAYWKGYKHGRRLNKHLSADQC